MAKFSHIELVLFDLDGTLVDSVPDLAIAVNQMLVALGEMPFPEQVVRGWVGNGVRVLVQRALSGDVLVDPSLPEASVERALALFNRFYAQSLNSASCLYPGVKHTLAQLRESGKKMAVVTNKPIQFVPALLEHFAISRYFDLVIGGDSLTRKKPDPLPLTHVCETLDCKPTNSLMVGDSKNDILAAKSANMSSVGLTYGYNYGEDIGISEPDLVLNNFADLLDVLDSVHA